VIALIEYLPRQYIKSPEVVEFQAVASEHMERFIETRDDLFDQFFVSSATWGLRMWEIALGLETDISKTYEFRRSRIESKLRGRGTTTKEMIRNVAASFSNGEVEVIEHSAEDWFEVKFIGTIGVPPNMDDLTAAIDEIKPAHLEYEYTYRYNRHFSLSKFKHGQLSKNRHYQLRNEELK
jgi:uncharacterized protein YmfQ (DUF2313 family)